MASTTSNFDATFIVKCVWSQNILSFNINVPSRSTIFVFITVFVLIRSAISSNMALFSLKENTVYIDVNMTSSSNASIICGLSKTLTSKELILFHVVDINVWQNVKL
jgi:hypothetical protein